MTGPLISRRRMPALLLGAGAALAAPGIIGRSFAGSGRELVMVSFGGALQAAQERAFVDPFEKETGIKVIRISGVDLAKLKAQVQAKDVEWDVVSFPDRLRYAAVRDGLLEKLDYSRFSTEDVIPDFMAEHCCGVYTYAAQLTYNVDAFKTGAEPVTWADFWNTRSYPGRRGQYTDAPYTLEFALLADGVRKEELYPLDVDRALRKLADFKHEAVWWSQFPQVEQLLLSKEIVASQWTRGVTAQLEGKPLKVSYDGAAISYSGWVVPRGSKNYDLAMAFIGSTLSPERQADCANRVAFGPVVRKALGLMRPNVAPLVASAPDNLRKGFVFDGQYWGENLQAVSETFNEWRIG